MENNTSINNKNIDEIPEFQPSPTSHNKVPSNDEFHFGPNAAPFTTGKLLDQSENLSTKALFGDESTATFDSTFDVDNIDINNAKNKQDPMSMSFYQDQPGDLIQDPTIALNQDQTIDLNAVQVLPDDLDDFLGSKSEEGIPHEDTISDLPEHDPNEGVQVTDLDKGVVEEKELASPVNPDEDLLVEGVCELPKSPLEHGDIPDLCTWPAQTLIQPEVVSDALDKFLVETNIQKDVMEKVGSPEPFSPPSPIPDSTLTDVVESENIDNEEAVLNSQPQIPDVSSPEPLEDVCRLGGVESPEVLSSEPIANVCNLTRSPVEESKDFVEQSCKLQKNESKEEASIESVQEDITSSVKDATSPIPDHPDLIMEAQNLNFAQELNNAVQDHFPVDLTSPIGEGEVLPDACSVSTPKSVATTDLVNSFVDTSLMSDIASPIMSPGGEQMLNELDPNHPLTRCVFPLPTHTRTDDVEIVSELIQAPVLETKRDELPPVLIPETQTEPEVVEKAAEAVAAGVSSSEVAEEKSPPKPKTTTTSVSKKAPIKASPRSNVAPKTTAAKLPATKPTAAVAPSKAKPLASKPTTTAVGGKGAIPKSSSALSKPAPKPRTATTTTATADKKLTNGDVKIGSKTNVSGLIKRDVAAVKSMTSTAKPSNVSKIGATKTTPTRPTTAPVRAAAPKPATAVGVKDKPAGTGAGTGTSLNRVASARAAAMTSRVSVAVIFQFNQDILKGQLLIDDRFWD